MTRQNRSRRTARPLVLGYLERIASSAFDEYPQQIRELAHGKHGVYALYKGDRLYYVGLATNLRNRVKHHLIDKLAGKWNRFSLYLVRKVEHIKELESVLLRIATPRGNRSSGTLPGAENLWQDLHDNIRQEQDRQIEKLFGVRKHASHKPRRSGRHHVYNARFYKTERNSESVDAFMRYADDLAALVKKQGWQLERKFNRGYCGFKTGFFNAFGIKWLGSRTFGIFIKISRTEANRHKPKPVRYAARWKEAYYTIEPDKTKIADFVPLFESACRSVAGTSGR